MSIAHLENLNPNELELIKKVPVYITFLIGAADKTVDQKEMNIAIRAIEFRTDHGTEETKTYYQWVAEEFETLLNEVSEEIKLHSGTERLEYITEKLSSSSLILQQLSKKYAYSLLESWKGVARAVAQASGSIIGSRAVSDEELHLMGLNMIHLE